MSDEANLTRDDSAPFVMLPETIVADLMSNLATTHKWIDSSLAGERAYSFTPATIIKVMKLEFEQIRAMNEDTVARAREWLPNPD